MLPKINRLSLRTPHPHGQRFVGQLINLEIYPTPTEALPVFGVVVSKKTAKLATDRNRIKRQINEVIRPLLPQAKKGIGVIVYAKERIVSAKYSQITRELTELLKNSGSFIL